MMNVRGGLVETPHFAQKNRKYIVRFENARNHSWGEGPPDSGWVVLASSGIKKEAWTKGSAPCVPKLNLFPIKMFATAKILRSFRSLIAEPYTPFKKRHFPTIQYFAPIQMRCDNMIHS